MEMRKQSQFIYKFQCHPMKTVGGVIRKLGNKVKSENFFKNIKTLSKFGAP